MALLRAIGLGVAIIVLRLLAPPLWNAVENVLLSFLSLGGDMIRYVASAIASFPPPAF